MADERAAIFAECAEIARELGRMARNCGQATVDPEVHGEATARAIEGRARQEVTPTIIVVMCEACGAMKKTPPG